MILLAWSLVLGAINYARRQRMATAIGQHFGRSPAAAGRLLLHRLSGTVSSLPRFSSEPAVHTANSVIYRSESFQVTAASARLPLMVTDWCFMGGCEEASLSEEDDESYVYFVASVKDEPVEDARDIVTLEELSSTLAWRRLDGSLEVLCWSTAESFVALAIHWADRLLYHQGRCEVDKLETVYITPTFKRRLAAKTMRTPTLERLCIDDIMAARSITESIAVEVSDTAAPSMQSSPTSSAAPSLLLSETSPRLSPLPSPIVTITPAFNGPAKPKSVDRSLRASDDATLAESAADERRLSDADGKHSRLIDRRRYTMVQSSELATKAVGQRPSPRVASPVYSDCSLNIPRYSSLRQSFRRRMSSATRHAGPTKPPCVLIYAADDDALFEKLRAVAQSCLGTDAYTVYRIGAPALSTEPWMENAACLLLAETAGLSEECWQRVQLYFQASGRLLVVCQNRLLASLTDCKSSRKRVSMLKMALGGGGGGGAFGKDFEAFLKRVCKQLNNRSMRESCVSRDIFAGQQYAVTAVREEGSPLLLYMENKKLRACALFSDATTDAIVAEGSTVIPEALERLGLATTTNSVSKYPPHHKLTCGYLYLSPSCPSTASSNYLSLDELGAKPRVRFCAGERQAASNERLPVMVNSDADPGEFYPASYFANLNTNTLGQRLVYIPVVTSTMDVCLSLTNALADGENPVVVAGRQLAGRGRGGNVWISPVGCAMFSFGLRIRADSRLGKQSGFIQHLLALAVVHGVCSRPGLEELSLRIKWPNDIHFGRQHKLGGVLVNCSFMAGQLTCVLGCGMNVSNSKPTLCLNELLPEGAAPITPEQLIAYTLTAFEKFVELFESKGHGRILPIYYDYWLHNREEVTLEDRNEKVTIRGLDSHGYLEVRSRQSGRVFPVHPDGNTFDMMKGLIRAK